VTFLGVFVFILILIQVVIAPFLGLTLVPNLSTLHHHQGLLLVPLPIAWLRLQHLLRLVLAFFICQIECHHCHAKGHIASRRPQRALVDCKDDNLLKDTDELLVMDPLESDYDGDSFMMYEDDSPLMRIFFQ